MPKATCRCGQALQFDAGSERVVCPACGARVKVRRPGEDRTIPASAGVGPDGYIRFHCPCGRRLKVDADEKVSHGRCPDCGAVVPVPPRGAATASRWTGPPVNDPERRTDELSVADAEALDAWIRRHRAVESETPAVPVATAATGGGGQAPGGGPGGLAKSGSVEAGFRVCPGCRRPVHLGADACRHCGTAVPRR